jgi:2-phospho-L-lactate/phosphoenolpyruvate guanylyltransferase
MSRQTVWAVVPVKPFAVAKRRLAPVLDRAERATLARLMLEDVVDVLRLCRPLAGIVIASADEAAWQSVPVRGVLDLRDSTHDLNDAVRTAGEFLGTQRGVGMLVVPSDIPLLPAALVDEMIDHIARPPAVALVPASRDGGTNLLACRPADAIIPQFGRGSFRRHCRLARSAGIAPTVVASAEAGLDIDRPDDLFALLAREETTRSQAFLAGLDLESRLHSDRAGGKVGHKVFQP